jgi:hypothetical protein
MHSLLKLTRPLRLVMTLALSVCVVSGCARPVPFTRAAVAQVGSDNAILTTLPAGTKLTFEKEDTSARFASLFVGAVRLNQKVVTLDAPVKVSSFAYLEERNRTEALIINDNQALQLENQKLRLGGGR